MADAATELQRQLQLLAEQFRQRLQRDLPELSAQAEALGKATNEAARQPLLLAIRQQLHKLAGSAGTFGFAALGEQARRLEQQGSSWLCAGQCNSSLLPAFIADLHQLSDLAGHGGQAGSSELLALAFENRRTPLDQRIAILEEDPVKGQSVELTLQNFGYQAHWYASAAELSARLAQQDVDALIIDSDHSAATELLASRTSQSGLPLLVISSSNDFATQLRAVRAGAVGFLCKPLNMPALENALQRLFSLQQGQPYRVLIVDDDQELANRYALVLRQHHMHVQVCHEPSTVLEYMARFSPEVLLLDVQMPDCEGPELAQIIRFNDDWLRVPIIYLSAETDLSRQMQALLRAGDDFVTKPISDNALITSVFSRAQRARQLSNALARDSLTGLLKHADIKEQVSYEVARAIRSRRPASVVMLDIDHFKQVNDQYGHPVGDNVIRALANLLRQRLRKIDSLGRYGGEEFLAVLPDCSGEQAQQVIEEIRQHFTRLTFQAGQQQFHCSFSAGVVQSNGEQSASELLHLADQALYAAKHGGRNQVRLAV